MLKKRPQISILNFSLSAGLIGVAYKKHLLKEFLRSQRYWWRHMTQSQNISPQSKLSFTSFTHRWQSRMRWSHTPWGGQKLVQDVKTIFKTTFILFIPKFLTNHCIHIHSFAIGPLNFDWLEPTVTSQNNCGQWCYFSSSPLSLT